MWGRAAALLLVVALTAGAPRPARASSAATGATVAQAVGFGALAAAFAYFAWLNRPAAQGTVDWGVKGPGGFFIGGFLGGGFVQSARWQLEQAGATTSRVNFEPSLLGGLKAGYFLHSFPYLGAEIEFMFDKHNTGSTQVSLTRPVRGSSSAVLPVYHINVSTLAFHFLARYGFLPDKEVPFGRLQPYVGLGPGFVILWSTYDSAKNLSLEASAGVRYMVRKNLSLFAEYKFSQQWEVELNPMRYSLPGVPGQFSDKATFDFTAHRFAVGVAFHFL
jgi:opacity protein-like surface antigen